MLLALDEAVVGRWCRAAVEALAVAQGRLDELNVFPVPDGDTGTNMLLTMQAAQSALDESHGHPAESVWAVMGRGAVLGARGNSGVILAQLLRGLSDSLSGVREVDGATFAGALEKAAESAYAAVADPEEGTFLTVARAAAVAAGRLVADGRSGLPDVVRAAADGARTALAATQQQLAVLTAAGVVDAGGAGWCVVLDALVASVTGVEPARAPLGRRPRRDGGPAHDHPHQPPPGPGSEVQYLLADSDEEAVRRLRDRLSALGDSVVLVGVDTPTGRQWNVHVHVSDVGAAIEAGIEAGRPHRVSVTPLAPVRLAAPQPGRRVVLAVLAAVDGAGLAELFAGEGVQVLATGPAGVTEQEILDAVVGSAAAEVVVLPNRADATAPAARAADRAREEGRDVAVIPTRCVVQGLAALAVTDPARRFGDDVIAMAEAAAATRWAEVTVADHEALTSVGRCLPGDVLGSADGDVVLIGRELAAVGRELLDRLLSAGGELATLVVGADAALGDVLCAHLSAVHPTVELTRYDGGSSPLLVGVE